MRFSIYDVGGKGAYLAQKLREAGHIHAKGIDDTDLLLLDCDWPWAHPRPEMIAAYTDAGAKVALYPHGGMPTVFVYDGLAEPDPSVSLRLEHGQASIDIARLFLGDSLEQHPVGWLYSPTRPFAPVDEPKRVLFAPMHPNIEALQRRLNGHDPAPAANQQVYRRLLDADYELTVSLVAPPHRNGVWAHPRAAFVANPTMQFTHSYQQILEADAVVATGTIAAAAVALGKPTVMFAQADCSDYIGGEYKRASHADLYETIVRYPLDVADGDLEELLARACAGSAEVEEWRAAFVGDDGTDRAVRLLEDLADVPLPQQANYEEQGREDVVVVGVPVRARAKSEMR